MRRLLNVKDLWIAFYSWTGELVMKNLQTICKGLESYTMGLNYGVPQGSVLGPSLYSIHCDGLQTSVEQSHCTLYADDTEIHASNASATATAASVNYDLKNIDQWPFLYYRRIMRLDDFGQMIV